ncbi:MCP four helix bundle domain-containing protein [Oxalobacteraceae bacterium]|nr:MCP four helix bundle domain-containing protein [Oxalobacteraceae bacterium]
MKIGNLKIGIRLGVTFGLMTAVLIAIVMIALAGNRAAEQRMDNMLDDRYRKIALGTEVKYNVALIHQHMRNAVIQGDAAGVRQQGELIGALRAKNRELLEQFDKIINVPKAREIFNAIVTARGQDLESQKALFVLLSAGNIDDAKALLGSKIADTEKAYIKLLTGMVELQSGKMAEEVVLSKAEFSRTAIMLLSISVAAIALTLGAAWYVTSGITGPLGEAVGIARKVAAGDLTVAIHVKSTDETGQLTQALKEMTDSLSSIVSEVRQGTELFVSATTQIATGNLDLSTRTEQQASSLEETAASMEELTSTVRQNDANTQQANRLAESASNVAVKGGAVVAQVVDTMGSINESSRKIVDIIGVIDGIAFQTNILALNAAVEAARAGEQGRGFAVVASEVRNLAQRSAAAAKEIKALIGDSVEKVEVGARLVVQAGATMEEVVASVRSVTEIMSQMLSAGHEQSTGIEQVNNAIVHIDETTQQNAALVEQAAAAAKAMQDQAAQLAQVVSVFKLTHQQVAQAFAPGGERLLLS